MIKTMQDCTDWRKLLLSHVDLLEIIKAVIMATFPKGQGFYEIIRRG